MIHIKMLTKSYSHTINISQRYVNLLRLSLCINSLPIPQLDKICQRYLSAIKPIPKIMMKMLLMKLDQLLFN
jgi:hypothetical protein